MASPYEMLLIQLTNFNARKDEYWDGLYTVVGMLTHSYTMYLGLPTPGWENTDGTVDRYVRLGKISDNEFVSVRTRELEEGDDAKLSFALKITLNPGYQPASIDYIQSSEEVVFEIGLSGTVSGYHFWVSSVKGPIFVSDQINTAGNFDPLWDVLTDDMLAMFDPEFFTSPN
ncbi:hypothetical protein [Pseudomonas tremae]|uniref:hypothetical protein n=1 Tax=Pseudomonas tremae TaxID=200454 RepID=UPI001F2F393E|nr:hypothetical protein [Pseudomonas tremae]MCF5806166.1 hypothetical protein [Pseudomonas tremae]MCF5811206.1 hypothetical protein [Pseudomonas tremae]